MTPRQAALEHITYCHRQGMTPEQVCLSIQVYLRDPTWTDALHAIMYRHMEMSAELAPDPVTDRRWVA